MLVVILAAGAGAGVSSLLTGGGPDSIDHVGLVVSADVRVDAPYPGADVTDDTSLPLSARRSGT